MAPASAGRWYAVHTHVQAEAFAASHLRRQGYGVLYLHYPATVRHARRQKRVLRPYFPRYLFTCCTELPLAPVAHTPGVVAIVQAGPDPLEVPGDVIAELAARADANGLVTVSGEVQKRACFVPGQEVAIASGPLQGLLATILRDDGGKIAVMLHWLNRQIKVALDSDALAVDSPALRSAPN